MPGIEVRTATVLLVTVGDGISFPLPGLTVTGPGATSGRLRVAGLRNVDARERCKV
ncbi:hypothetical protein [Streptomyces sp. NPDC048637]|uniref:hypothetical protein n=1 Tax=Streptomyces sp. NPDC048637 TaxID=3155636 RepID=UPI0034440C19